MTDREMLDLLAAEAPVPGPGHVDDILTRARRARHRRQVTLWGAGLGAAAVTLVGGSLVALSADGQRDSAAPPASTGSAQRRTPPSSAPPTTIRPRTAEAEVYASAVRSLANEVREGGPQWPVLYVLDHTCANIVTPPGEGSCDPQTLPAQLRSDLTAALASYAPVQFIADGIAFTDPGPGLVVINGGVVVTLGRVRLDGDRAEVALSVRRNGLNGRGLTYRLTRQGQAWQVVDTVGPQWIS